MRRQIVNEHQQPNERHYQRDRDTYYRDEARDFSNGVDYLPQRRRYAGDRGQAYDSPNNVWQQRHQDYREYSDHLYTPSFDYGYERGEYYPMDPSRMGHQTGQATGYGNDRSAQGRDFENWLHGRGNYNTRHQDHGNQYNNFNSGRFDDHNRDFEERRNDYQRNDQTREEERRGFFSRFRRRSNNDRDNQHGHYDRYHNRSDRHQEIVVPFKDEEYYSQNDYNHSEGFGNNEMVYHNEQRRRGHRGW